MNYLQVPVQAIPSQSIAILLNNQKCVITLREMLNNQYFSLISNGKVICNNLLLQNNSTVIDASYTGFVGDFAVEDLQGSDRPSYEGWGSRWVLMYYYE